MLLCVLPSSPHLCSWIVVVMYLVFSFLHHYHCFICSMGWWLCYASCGMIWSILLYPHITGSVCGQLVLWVSILIAIHVHSIRIWSSGVYDFCQYGTTPTRIYSIHSDEYQHSATTNRLVDGRYIKELVF